MAIVTAKKNVKKKKKEKKTGKKIKKILSSEVNKSRLIVFTAKKTGKGREPSCRTLDPH